ncbi:MAG: DUF4249 family protein [Melioribacteraceae bacterium]|nr:DUF4249 family protein [Melioribacteraceae bacterium]
MKKLIQLFLTLTILFTLSCDDSLNPYGELKERFVLNCIIRADTTFQTATLSKSYQPIGINPYDYNDDNAITNAKIRIWNKDKVTLLRDSSVTRPDGDQYSKPYRVYYSNNFSPEPASLLEIEAILPDGRKLTSSANVPASVTMSKLNSDDIIDGKKSFLKFVWQSGQRDPVFIPKLIIHYFRDDPDGRKKGTAIVPLNYQKFGNEYIPNYPKPSNDYAYSVDAETLNKAMELISGNDNNKARYIILSCILEVISLDPDLSSFYNASSRERDVYSVKLDETDFTNIKGGYGVFGVYTSAKWVARFKHAYIRSFGYTPGLSDPI